MSLPIDLWYQRYWDEFSVIFYPKAFGQKQVGEPNTIANGILPIVAKQADYAVVEALAKFVARLAHTHPRDIDSITRALSIVQSQPGVPTLTIYKPRKWTGRSKTNYGSAMSICLGEVIDEGLEDAYADDEEEDGDLSLQPENIRLTTAILSASAVKYGLQTPEKAVAAIRLGLEDTNEVFAVIACIHLAISGDRTQQFLEDTLPDGGLQLALGELRVSNIVRSPAATDLLKRTMAIADSKFSRMLMLSEQETWDILFPKNE